MTIERYSRDDLLAFKRLQRLAYDAVEEVEAQLELGMTERRAAELIRTALGRRGVSQFFHVPFAWFGDRTCFSGFRTPLDFFPSNRRLERGMAVILDVAPISRGYSADIGFTTSFGENAAVAQAKKDLQVFRTRILEMVRAGETLQRIYRQVDEIIADLGYTNAHYHYPFHTLGHKVGRMPLRRLPSGTVGGFDARTLLYLYRQMLEARLPLLGRRSPIWNGHDRCAVSAEPGLWAVEPHIGRGDFGAKWEEMLVVTDSDATWLDDDLPHVRGWRAAEGGARAAA